MPNVLQYPRGYVVSYPANREEEIDKTLEKGDVELNTLFNMYLTSTVNTDGWEYREKILQMAIRFFGDINRWFAMQANNACLYGNNYDFLTDLLNYVEGGERRLAVLSWEALLYDFPAALPQGVVGRTFNVNYTTEEFLSKWCSRSLGFEDMLCTMHVLFGDALPTALRCNTNCN